MNKSMKFKNAVTQAVFHNALMTYVTHPSKLKGNNYKYRYQTLVKYMKNNPINIRQPLYRGVPRISKYMPNKGNYNTGGRLVSFAKNLNTAKFFAKPGGTIYVLPPGRYPAFNISNNVNKRYPNVRMSRNALKYPKNVQRYIGFAKTEDEVLLAPGVFSVGNVRNNNNKSKVYKNITYRL